MLLYWHKPRTLFPALRFPWAHGQITISCLSIIPLHAKRPLLLGSRNRWQRASARRQEWCLAESRFFRSEELKPNSTKSAEHRKCILLNSIMQQTFKSFFLVVSPEVAGSCAVICMASTFCKLRFGVWPAAVALRLNISIAGALKRGSGQTKDLTCAYLYRLNPSSPDRFKEGDWMRFHLLKGQSTKPWQFCFRSDRLVNWSWAKKTSKPIQAHLSSNTKTFNNPLRSED